MGKKAIVPIRKIIAQGESPRGNHPSVRQLTENQYQSKRNEWDYSYKSYLP